MQAAKDAMETRIHTLAKKIATAGRIGNHSHMRGLIRSGRALSQSALSDDVDRAAQGLVRAGTRIDLP